MASLKEFIANTKNMLPIVTGKPGFLDAPSMHLEQVTTQIKAILGLTDQFAPPAMDLEQVTAQVKAILGVIDQFAPPSMDLEQVTAQVKSILGLPDQFASPAIDLEATKAHVDDVANPHAVTFTQVGAIEDAANAVTDNHIGDRTADSNQTPISDTADLTTWFHWLTNRIKAITGGATWRTAPATTLAAVGSHVAALNNPHNVTAVQAGAAPSNGSLSDFWSCGGLHSQGAVEPEIGRTYLCGSSTRPWKYVYASDSAGSLGFFHQAAFYTTAADGFKARLTNTSGSLLGTPVPMVASAFNISPSNASSKVVVENVDNSTTAIRGLQPVRFRYTWEDPAAKVRVGFIAEDLETSLPDAVSDLAELDEDSNPIKAIDIGVIAAACWQSIRELDARITALEP